MNDLPLEIVLLGLNIDDYVAMAHNVKRVLNIGENSRKRILSRADIELSEDIRIMVIKLSKKMCRDRRFFEEAGLRYANGSPVSNCFITTVADYLLRNQERIGV